MADRLGPITLLMINQHSLINSILSRFEVFSKEKGLTDKARNIFLAFRWNLEKHIFIEEKIIFTVTDRKSREESRMVADLLNDHRDVMSIVDIFTKKLFEGIAPKITELRGLLLAHENKEIEGFYPLLDNRLSKKSKKDMIQRAEEVVLG